jgi:hypothetical protein
MGGGRPGPEMGWTADGESWHIVGAGDDVGSRRTGRGIGARRGDEE